MGVALSTGDYFPWLAYFLPCVSSRIMGKSYMGILPGISVRETNRFPAYYCLNTSC